MQDSRMRPNLQEGIWSELNLSKTILVKGGWLWGTSPRSTIHWYGIGESVGIYGNGKATDGSSAKYHGHVESNGIGIANITLKPSTNFSYHVWNYYADNIFNLVLHKAEIKKQVQGMTVFAGAQHLWQKSISPKNLPVENQYIAPHEMSQVLSFRLGLAPTEEKNTWSINYTRITSHGRFLFPREWGTETLYTYISRERNEGSGDVHAWMLENTRSFGKDSQLNLQAKAGVYKMPSVIQYSLNKYSVPSYYHLTLKARYKFKAFLNGLEAQALYVYKGNLENQQHDKTIIHNKVGMHHAALVLDYYF